MIQYCPMFPWARQAKEDWKKMKQESIFNSLYVQWITVTAEVFVIGT